MSAPNYLSDYVDLWEKDSKKANLAWFEKADYGLFLHYGLYSQLGRHEWVMHREKIPVAEYEKLAESFSPSKFDADRITDLACEGGMKYVNLTTCHHEGFCLWQSNAEAFNSYSFSRRDLVRELAAACDEKGLGFFAYYTNVLNWRHPYAMPRGGFFAARPDYPEKEPRYLLDSFDGWEKYWEYATECIKELCQIEFPLAGIWLDIIMAYYVFPEHIPIEDIYEQIRELRPEALIAFKQGATGTEDYASPEFHFASLASKMKNAGSSKEAVALAEKIWALNKEKHNEICWTLQEGTWGYRPDAKWKDADSLWQTLGYARHYNCNLLANIGPKADGSLPEESVRIVREVGRRIREHGMPVLDSSDAPGGDGGAGEQ